MAQLGWKRDEIRPIGLEISYRAIRMIQLGQSEEGLFVQAADEVRLDPDIMAQPEPRREFTVSAIREMLARGGFRGREAVSNLPNDVLRIKSMRLDQSADDLIDHAVCRDVAQRMGLDADRDEIRYMLAGDVYQGEDIRKEVIFFGTDKATIEGHIHMLETAGLHPTAVDAVPCALFRSVQSTLRRQEDQNQVTVFVEVASNCTTVVIGRGQEIAFIKQIPIGGEQLNAEVAGRLGIELAEAALLREKLRNAADETIDAATRQAATDAMTQTIEGLAREVSLCFRYYTVTFRGERPAEVHFAGGEAQESTLIEALERHLGIEIKIAHPLRNFDLSRVHLDGDDAAELCRWAVAVGLSMKGWDLVPSRA